MTSGRDCDCECDRDRVNRDHNHDRDRNRNRTDGERQRVHKRLLVTRRRTRQRLSSLFPTLCLMIYYLLLARHATTYRNRELFDIGLDTINHTLVFPIFVV